jgi:hypothetical protein
MFLVRNYTVDIHSAMNGKNFQRVSVYYSKLFHNQLINLKFPLIGPLIVLKYFNSAVLWAFSL